METNQKVAEVISLFLTSLLPNSSFTVDSLACSSEVVSMEAFDFSGITVPASFFEDDIHLERVQISVNEGILKTIDETAESLDINAIPEELHLLPRDMMVEWLKDKENEKPNSSKKPKLDGQRFGKTVTSNKMLKQYSEGFVPKNTDSNTQWAVCNFEAWRVWRNSTGTDGTFVPETRELLTGNDASVLNHWLSLFVIETKRSDGNSFPSKTIDLLLAGLKRYMVAELKEKDPSVQPVNFLSESDHRFAGLRGTRDRIARERRQMGIGAEVKHTEVFTTDEEDVL